ncbi:MAG: heme-binding domain-containing protein [Oligoflexus sp.]|jgi:hypothetical protein
MTVARPRSLACVIWLSVLISLTAWAHAGHEHGADEERTPQAPQSSADPVKLDRIAVLYDRDVAPLFTRACGDCHSKHTQYPWYYGVPGIRQLIDADIDEARSHLDLTAGFPFISHAVPREDILAIQKALKDGSMPPSRYAMMHDEAALSEAEKQGIFRWLDMALEIIDASPAP